MAILNTLKNVILAFFVSVITTLLVLFLLIDISNSGPRPVDVSSQYYDEIQYLIEKGERSISIEDNERLYELIDLHNQIADEKLRKAESVRLVNVKEQWGRHFKFLSIFSVAAFLATLWYLTRRSKDSGIRDAD